MTAPIRIVVTGGPGGGKTTALDLFRREIGARVAVVPESATMLFQGGFPRSEQDDNVKRAGQASIFAVQRGLEQAQAALYPGRVLLCDRGTVDGAVYWPGSIDDYFAKMGATLDDEMARYHAVLFFETAAAGGHDIKSGNPQRIESKANAVQLDRELLKLWSKHPRLHVIKNNTSFFQKVTEGVQALSALVDECERRPK
ncbi:MAG: AAA family ATPase [Deltaproteobacteria bacterium]|nr:AAA family ATPase [Deltaproteobacteria bacterium]